MLSTPLHNAVALMPRQVIPNEQDTHRREKAIKLFSCRIDIPILPAPTLRNFQWCRGTLLEDGLQFTLEPGMQDGVRALLYGFCTDFSSCRSKQREQFGRPATHVLVRSMCRITLGLEGRARLRDPLVGTPFILAPQL